MSPQQIAKLAGTALDAACAHIQERLDQDDGGVAALFFSGETGDAIQKQFIQYIELELSMKEQA